MTDKPETKVIPENYDLEESFEKFENDFTDHLDASIYTFLEEWTDEQMEFLADEGEEALSPVEDILSYLKSVPWFEARQELDSALSAAINTAIIEFKNGLKALVEKHYRPSGE